MSKTLNDVCLLIVDCEHRTAPKSEQGYPLIRTTDIGRGRIDLSDVQRVDAAAYEEWTRRAVPQPGDLILAREAPVGNVAIVTAGIEPVLGQRTVLIRPDPEIVDPDFLTYRLLGYDIQYWMNGVANGATVPHLNMEDIRALPLPELPDLETQRRLGGVLAAFDDLVERNAGRIRILEQMAKLIYREWFVHFQFPGHNGINFVDSELGRLPEGWKVMRLGGVIELAYGKALIEGDRNGGHVAVIGSSGIVGWHDKALVPGPGIVVGRKGYVGSVHWSDTDFYPIDTTYFVKTELPLLFVYQLLHTLQFVDSHAAIPGLSREQAYGLPFVKPPIKVLQAFEEKVGPLFALRYNLTKQNETLRSMRDRLLPRLVSGQLDVADLHCDPEAVAR